jgi:hypothetical protein
LEVIEENMRAIQDEIEAKVDTTMISGQNVMGAKADATMSVSQEAMKAYQQRWQPIKRCGLKLKLAKTK